MTREDARGTWPPRPPSAQSSVKQDVLHSGVGRPRVVGPASYQAGGTVCSVTAETCALALINVGGKKNKNGCIKNMFDNGNKMLLKYRFILLKFILRGKNMLSYYNMCRSMCVENDEDNSHTRAHIHNKRKIIIHLCFRQYTEISPCFRSRLS